MESFIQARLVDWRKINVAVYTNTPYPSNFKIILYKEEEVIKKEVVKHFNLVGGILFFDLLLEEDFVLGINYRLIVGSKEPVIIDTSGVVDFPSFDEKYAYDGDDLGNVYHPSHTVFTVWAPLASMVLIKLINSKEEVSYRKMNREEKGIYRLEIAGDLLNYKYHYIVHNNGVIYEANDPYAKEVSLNSEYSLVVDVDQLLKIKNIVPKNVIKNYVEAVIYETHIRDINEDKFNDVVHKGKYLGFVEEGRKTPAGNPAGLDYIKYLGVSHVQIQPVLDFDSKDDIDTSFWYNWGYDPLSFFALEGSYSLHPDVPMARMFEFKEMVNKLHQSDLRVIIDVVYNHIHEYENSDLEKIVPHYYFRKSKHHKLSNLSGCGNDFASERKMARKIIIDSVKYLFKYYDIDGLRFDLMGLLDIETVKAAYIEAKKIKKDIMFYGEGWHMDNENQTLKRANKGNAPLLQEFAFFNDVYRDIIKGPSMAHNLGEKGYICGNTDYVYGVDYAFHASTLPLSYKPLFKSANQSVNFIECHDNNTLFDKLLVSNANEDERTLLDRVNLANGILLLSFGIPFVHMGQEIGLSKGGLNNTYKTRQVNNLDYRLVDERFDMVNRFRILNILRKKLAYTRLFTKEEMTDFFEISHRDNGLYVLLAKDKNVIANEKEFVIFINPTTKVISFELDDYYTVVEGAINQKEMSVKNGFLPGCNLLLLFLKK
ncbi:MAG TPA: type I pullulanase [Erysipelotrichaceae bacterium]|nr:type I pullulanase [Erysipelotrichaceae bacterium]